MQRSVRTHELLSVAIFDIDLFKAANDRFVHYVGDELLKIISEFLRAKARDVDVLVR